MNRPIRSRTLPVVACLTVALAAVLAEPTGSPVRRPGAEARADPLPARLAGRATAPRRAAPLYTARSVRAARRWAEGRPGLVAFAVLGERGRLRGRRRTLSFPSASVVKAMLLAAQLRATGPAAVPPAIRHELRIMVTESDNDAALTVFARVGRAGLERVARLGRMASFSVAGHLFDAQVTSADLVRLFLRLDGLVPRRHRAYARRLLGSVIAPQRWGIARVAEERGFTPYFKGGWRTGLVHQVALLERGRRRVAVAVLTGAQRTMEEGVATIEGIARRALDRGPARGRVLAPFAAGLSRA